MTLPISVHLSVQMDDSPIYTKFYSLMQNNMSLNIWDGLNFVRCEQTTNVGDSKPIKVTDE